MNKNWFITQRNRWYDWLTNNRLSRLLQRIPFPWTGGASVFRVIVFFYQRLVNENITIRAGAITFTFFLALFPGLIFIFTLLPYLPLHDLQTELLGFLKEILPQSAFSTIESTLTDILITRRGSLLSFGFVMTIYFSSNGINSLLQAFNPITKRRFFHRYFLAFVLTIILAVLILSAISVQILSNIGYQYLLTFNFFENTFFHFSYKFFKILLQSFLIITSISILYHYGTVKKERFIFFSPGAFLATVYIGLTSAGFSWYVEHFAQYNKLYGSIGALIVLMMFIYLNSIGLITGFEFNQGILEAKEHNSENPKTNN